MHKYKKLYITYFIICNLMNLLEIHIGFEVHYKFRFILHCKHSLKYFRTGELIL